MSRLHLSVFNSEVNGKSRRITSLHQENKSKKIEIFYEFDRLVPFTEDTLLDGHVLPVLLYASSNGKPLIVHGALSQKVMRNMHELLLAWSLWRPHLYKMIEIVPDRILDKRLGSGTREKAISAFSGGVDATFTAIRHTNTLTQSTRYPLTDVLMVHGFDVDVHNKSDFQQLVARVKPLIEDLNIGLRIIRTNSRDLKLQDWEDSFALELAGCLHMLSDEFQYGLIGSSEPYDALVLPWGSNPATDYLMSGDDFSIIHDGAGFSRTDKVAEIINHKLACKTLKVCYEGMDQSNNCGRCEKCVRTQLNFLAAGAQSMPACFPSAFNVNLIHTIEVNNKAQLAELVSIVKHAEAHHITGPWIDALRTKIESWQPMTQSALNQKRNGNILKRSIAKGVTLIGLDEPAKKIWRSTRRKVLKRLGK